MSQIMVNVLITAAPWALLVVGVMLAAAVDPYIDRRSRRLILVIAWLVLLLMNAEMQEYTIWKGEANDLLRTCASAFGYAVRPVLIVLFMQLLFPYRRRWPFWLVAGFNVGVYTVSIFTGVAFRIVDNTFHRGPLNHVCLVVSVLLMMDLSVMLIRTSLKNRRQEVALVLFSAGMIVLGTAMDGVLAQLHIINFLTMAIIGSTIFYYLWLHLQLEREHEEKVVQNLMAEHRIQLMISQIQPHFLFNTLSSIQALCMMAPEQAADLTERFGQYLRENLDSLGESKLVPFAKEIAHTKTYTSIEQVRFPSISLSYDLQDVDFDVPALTIQPLVENAIRHGVRLRVNGEIQVASRLEADAHVVAIRDNGIGFDVEQAFRQGSRHIGLRNVRERVEQMCGGMMEIDSHPGQGTSVTLRFPISNPPPKKSKNSEGKDT